MVYQVQWLFLRQRTLAMIKIPAKRPIIPDSDDEETEASTPAEDLPRVPAPPVIERAKRGRPPKKNRHAVRLSGVYDGLDGDTSMSAEPSRAQTPMDLDEADELGGIKTRIIKGKAYPVEGDEVVLDDDPDGEKKIDKNGNLLGGREYISNTFTMPTRSNPEKRYMLAIDAAHAAGMRDSLDFFRKNPLLIKTNCTRYEKEQFIIAGRVHPNMKNKNIALVACRNAYKILGAKFIRGGRYVIDDYYEQAAILSGFQKGAPAIVQPYTSKREEEERAAGGSSTKGQASSSLALIPKGLQDALEKDPKTQFAPASHVPFAKWDPAAKQRKPGPFTQETWCYKYAQAITQHNSEIRRWREDQFHTVPLSYTPKVETEDLPAQVKAEDPAGEVAPPEPSDVPMAAVEAYSDAEDGPETPARPPPVHPIGRVEPHTNLPHVQAVTQPSSAVWELLEELPSVSEDEALPLRRAAARRGMFSVQLMSDVVVLDSKATREREWDLQRAHWPRLPGGWEFGPTR